MTAQPIEHSPYDLPIRNLRELRTALAKLATLPGVPTELERFDAELNETPIPGVAALIERYADYYRANTTPEALEALTMGGEAFEAQLRRKLGAAG